MTSDELQSLGMKPRLAAIVSTDWPALLFAMSLPVIWLICAQLPFVSREGGIGGTDALAIAIAGTVVALAGLGWRIARIHRLFAHGRRLRGRISNLAIAKDRARLELTYDFGGVRLTAWTRVYGNRRVQSLKLGQDVDLLVDPERREHPIVLELYL